MWFKCYEHFHKLTTDGQTDSHSDYSVDPRVVQDSLSEYSAESRVVQFKSDVHANRDTWWLSGLRGFLVIQQPDTQKFEFLFILFVIYPANFKKV